MSLLNKIAPVFMEGDAISWSNKASTRDINDAYHTWNKHYRNEMNPRIDKNRFKQLVKKGRYLEIPLKYLIDHPIENLNLKRVSASSVSRAYPVKDRPRGEKDLQSVKRLIKNGTAFPIIIIHNTNRVVLLDGVHRLVASKLTNTKNVRALVLKI